MNPAEKIWWMKLGISLAVACLTLVIQTSFNLGGIPSLMVGVIAYLGLSDVLSSVMGVDRSRGLKIGVGVYFFTWLTVWIFLYTLLHLPG